MVHKHGDGDKMRHGWEEATVQTILRGRQTYHARDIYRFRFARICVPPLESAFLFASLALEVGPSGAPLVAGEREVMVEDR